MKRSLHGFTLVELLVVITIIGMLVGLLLPAVNMARESGRKVTCTNNLGQLQKACLQHVNKYGFYPGGGWGSNRVGNPNAGTGQNQPGGWIYQILPFMDNDTLHEMGKGSNLTASSSGGVAMVSMPLQALYCPTRRAYQAYPISGTGASPQGATQLTVTQAGRTDYAMNGGSVLPSSLQNYGSFPHFQGPSSVSSGAGYQWPLLSTGSTLTSFNGIAAIHSQVLDATLTDNRETNYLIGEKYLSVDNYVTGVDSTNPPIKDEGDLFSAMSGDDVSLTRWCTYNASNPAASLLPSPDRMASNNPPPNPALIFGSSHSSGWHVAFCDGHVQPIGWGIDGPLHQAMATRNGHEVVNRANIPP